MESKELTDRKKILNKFIENPDLSGGAIAESLKMNRTTVNGVIKRYKETMSVKRKPGSGGKRGGTNEKTVQMLLQSFKDNPEFSDNDRAKRYGTSRSYVAKLRANSGIKSYHATKKPIRNDNV